MVVRQIPEAILFPLQRGTGIQTIRSFLISLTIGVALLLCLEMAIRLLWPQLIVTTQVSGSSLGLRDDVLGHRYRPNAYATDVGPEYEVEYKINEDGMRDESDHFSADSASATRILLLGDSFTFGQGVNYEHIWPVILEQRLRAKGHHVDVVKAGVQGYSTWQQVLLLEQLLPKYNPDFVFLVFLPNDLFPSAPIGQARTRGESAQSNGGISFARSHSRFHSVELFKRILISSDYLYTRLYLLRPWPEYFTRPESPRLQSKIEEAKELILKARSHSESCGATFLVLSIPQQFQVLVKANDYEIGNIDVDLIDDRLSEFARDRQITWIQTLDLLATVYRSEGESLFFRSDGHLTEKGNLLVADHFLKEFNQRLFQN